jgi:hypothetical protein
MMSTHIQCQCGNLAEWVSDPGIPYVYNPHTDSYFLKLSDTVLIPDVYCHFSGGHVPFHFPKGLPFCKCGFLVKCQQDPSLPIKIGNTGNMYEIRCIIRGKNGSLAIWFCPACGGTA